MPFVTGGKKKKKWGGSKKNGRDGGARRKSTEKAKDVPYAKFGEKPLQERGEVVDDSTRPNTKNYRL